MVPICSVEKLLLASATFLLDCQGCKTRDFRVKSNPAHSSFRPNVNYCKFFGQKRVLAWSFGVVLQYGHFMTDCSEIEGQSRKRQLRVAVADDDREILESLSQSLRNALYNVEKFSNGRDLMTALRRDTYDVVLVDWNMPGATGFELVSWGVENLEHPPAFILLTSRSDKSDIVEALEGGASDYIVKPESEDVVIARIEAAARRANGAPRRERILDYGAYQIDTVENAISLNGDPIKLTGKEYQLACLFFDNLDRPMSRAYIYTSVWGGAADVATRTLDMHVSRIRSKLDLRPHNGFAIRTVFGFGYRMDQYSEDDS